MQAAQPVRWTVGVRGPSIDLSTNSGVAFLESPMSLVEARTRKQELLKELPDTVTRGAEIVIFSRAFLRDGGTYLCQVDPYPESTATSGCDLFLITKELLRPDARAEMIRQVLQIVDDFSHQRPPTSGGPP